MPTRCTARILSPSVTRASSTVMPGYSEVITTAMPNSPARAASR
jgi:hypothetical protein